MFFQTDERVEIREGASYVDYQTNMVKLAKNIARTAQDMVRTSSEFTKGGGGGARGVFYLVKKIYL